MAQSGYTPISLYYSSSTGTSPTAGNMVAGELAINTADGILFYKNPSNVVTPLSSSGGSLSWQAVQSANFTAVAGNGYYVNTTSGAITVTLPASPTAGQFIALVDYAGTFATNKLTVNPNGNKFLGSSGSVLLQTNREAIAVFYVDSTQGWLIYDGFNASIPAAATYTASYLIVAGGGGGGSASAGGGGAGGLLTSTATLTPGTVYSFTVGGGGAGNTVPGAGNGTNGTNSTGLSLTSIGGGGGGNGGFSGTSGGSGGGGGNSTGSNGGSGTTGQGNAGGNGNNGSGSGGSGVGYDCGGGGGAGAAGGNGTTSSTGNGGVGLQSSITGSSLYYAGGGGGGSDTYRGISAGGAGGSGGGGNGGTSPAANGADGSTNTGGGGGGGAGKNTSGTGSNGNGGSGGSGVVILSVPTANYSGTTTGSPTVTTSGANTIIKFTASGSYTA